MDVKDLLQKKSGSVVSIKANKTVEDAIQEMGRNKISALIVTEKERTVGIFTERDVVRCYIANSGKNFGDVVLRDAMTKNVIVAEQDDDISSIMSIMVEKNIRHLPVIEKGKVIGMLSIRDIIQTQVKNLTAEIHYLKDYITTI